MMPLNLANVGEETLILKVGGNPETRDLQKSGMGRLFK